MRALKLHPFVWVVGAIVAIGCGAAARRATATIDSKSGSTVKGTATFDLVGNNTKLVLNVEGAAPGMRAAHIHETGDCSAANGSTAGAHWNPSVQDHGDPTGATHHLGDLGNFEVNAEGKGTLTISNQHWSIGSGSLTDIVGKAVIVHGGTDTFTAQPAGDAGPRVGCGVIELTK
jgi:superoxide dismutase, Cu-Zn family